MACSVNLKIIRKKINLVEHFNPSREIFEENVK